MEDEGRLLDAEDALAEVARIRTTTRETVRSLRWSTSVLWGLVFLGSVVVWLTFDNSVVSMLYWYVAVPAAIVTTWRLESPLPRLSRSPSFSPNFSLISVAMVIGSFGTWYVFDARLSALVWYSVLLGGFALFATVDGDRWVAVGIAVLWVWGVLVWLAADNTPSENDLVLALFATAIGAGFLGTGFGQRLGHR